MDVQINTKLQKKYDPGFTIFAPTDSAFSNLKQGRSSAPWTRTPPAPPPLPPEFKNVSPPSNDPPGSISSSVDSSDATCLRYAPTAISFGVAPLSLWLLIECWLIMV
ncbi:hypothetical protein CK203_044746 [Vitis vinifera]|uniref:FAS1 domain-containing protein n=1 Tax=Vitis vinifera TaxID=29760 RepID=A0A438H6Y3_VITVI|nr:hypothetical protein CK203_044746 [Vitis vinifera]